MSKIGNIINTEITKEMKKSYLDYAMSVIVSRALPDVRDGLKPVHRRILFAMKGMGQTHKASFSKSAKIVGEVMGKYHPHGDQPIYGAMVRLAQDFSMRYPLVHGQGNFGSVDGDPPAAMRYTEAKMAKFAAEILADIDKQTVPFVDNFDGSLQEPVYLPSRIPNLILMGSDGIAVGMATKIPPHNLTEVVDALLFMLNKGKVVTPEKNAFDIQKINLLEDKDTFIRAPEVSGFEVETNAEELIKYIKGPDFPTGAAIFGKSEILKAYLTGKGKMTVRAKAETEEDNRGRLKIVISEIPYQVNKANLIEKIAHMVRDKKIVGIGDLRDESDQRGMSIVIELKKNAKPKVVLNKLYKFTQMQTTYAANMVALINGIPKLMTLRQILLEFIHHRQQVITRRTFQELKEAKHRAHILEGLKIALDNLDEVIETIKKSKDAEVAKTNLMKKFSLSDLQAEAILEMQLRRLAALERKKIEDEYKAIMELIDQLVSLLTYPEKIIDLIKEELTEIKNEYGDERRTKIFAQGVDEFSEEDLIPAEECLITLTETGYIKRMPLGTYHSQRRGGKGVTGMTTKEEDDIAQIFSCNTHDQVLFFTNKGRVFAIPAWEIDEGSRQSKCHAVINLINIEQDEQIQAVLPLAKQNGKRFIFMVTRNGTVKKTSLEKFANIRASGLIALKLRDDDQLCWVNTTNGDDHVLLISYEGKSIRFKETDARPMQRDTMGVRGINLKKGDFVVAAETFSAIQSPPKDKRKKHFRDVVVIMEKGLGKRTGLKEYPLQKRGGVGVKVANATTKTGKVVAAQIITQKHRKMIVTSKKAQVIKLPLKNIPRLGRDTQGVIIMRFSKSGDTVAAAACL